MMNREKNKQSDTPILDSLLNEISLLDFQKTEDRMLAAARIADLLKEKGWSKSFFAEKLEQQPLAISKWLSGTHNFTLETLTEITYILDISLADFFNEFSYSNRFSNSENPSIL